jgi:hypothetical protein
MSATTTQLLSSGEFCKLRYDTILVKLHLQTFLPIPVTQECQILSCDTLVANERNIMIVRITEIRHETIIISFQH